MGSFADTLIALQLGPVGIEGMRRHAQKLRAQGDAQGAAAVDAQLRKVDPKGYSGQPGLELAPQDYSGNKSRFGIPFGTFADMLPGAEVQRYYPEMPHVLVQKDPRKRNYTRVKELPGGGFGYDMNLNTEDPGAGGAPLDVVAEHEVQHLIDMLENTRGYTLKDLQEWRRHTLGDTEANPIAAEFRQTQRPGGVSFGQMADRLRQTDRFITNAERLHSKTVPERQKWLKQLVESVRKGAPWTARDDER